MTLQPVNETEDFSLISFAFGDLVISPVIMGQTQDIDISEEPFLAGVGVAPASTGTYALRASCTTFFSNNSISGTSIRKVDNY